jgi:polyisoprenoid-binding protein YceI
MKKKTFLFTFLIISQIICAQKYFTRTGTTNFKASVATFEAIEATNKSTTVILKTDTGDIAAQLFIAAFTFKVALMQEHFNENYMDSDKFPKATFRGKLEGFSIDTLKKEYPLLGTLTIRGIKKEIETTARLMISEGTIYITSNFTVKPQDFDIKIPSIVRKKIAESININLNYELVEKK